MPPMSLVGKVTRVGFMKRTATVLVERFYEHPITRKRLIRSKKYLTHDAQEELRLNDRVLIRNCPKLSARKAFTLEKILGREKLSAMEVEAEAVKAAASAAEGRPLSSVAPTA